jgi:flagellin
VPQVINTNVPSLNAQYNLTKTQVGLDQTLQRLSTGLRINGAADDAAGLAISDRFTTQIKGTDQAIRNASDGISMVQTAEGALSTMTSSLQRIRELAVQSANATNTATDRMALDMEVQELIADIRYTAFNTEFNGMAVLDGSKGDAFFQVGANQGQMISINNLDARSIRLGCQEAFPQNPVASDTPPVGGDLVRLSKTQAEALADDTAAYINDITITGAANTQLDLANATPIVASGPHNSLEEAVAAINKEIQVAIDAGDQRGQAINASGLKAMLRTDNNGDTGIVITSNANPDIETDPLFQTAMFTVTGGEIESAGATNPDVPVDGTFLFQGNDANAAAVASTTALAYTLDPFNTATPPAAANERAGLDILTRETATRAIGIVDGALSYISAMRSEMGAVQNRFEARIDNLGVSSVNMSASRSRILDADFAAETAKLTKYQILQQSGITVLTQANSLPQSALSLLQG